MCVLAVAFTARDALAAGEDDQAKVLFDNGRVLYQEGQYADAIAAWERAYQLSSRPLILFNIANAYERNGQVREAIDNLNRYRAFAAPQEREVLLRRIRNLEARLSEVPAGVVAPPSSAPKRLPVADLSLIGLGVVGISVGVGLGSSARNYGTKAEPFCGGSLEPCKRPAEPFLKKERTLSAGADISYALGAAAIAGGVTMWVLRSKRSNSDVSDVMVAPTWDGMVVHGRF